MAVPRYSGSETSEGSFFEDVDSDIEPAYDNPQSSVAPRLPIVSDTPDLQVLGIPLGSFVLTVIVSRRLIANVPAHSFGPLSTTPTRNIDTYLTTNAIAAACTRTIAHLQNIHRLCVS